MENLTIGQVYEAIKFIVALATTVGALLYAFA